MHWNTKVTDFLGCKYPILQGAMMTLGRWKFATAVANAGAHGTIAATASRTPQQLKEDIRNCKENIKGTQGTFGVNLSIGLCPNIEEMLEVCVEEKVIVETSVFKPDALASRIKDGGLKWIHKAARVKDAVHAQDVGADVIILVGLEGAGIKNPQQLPTMTTIIWGRSRLTVPLVAAGGIGNGHGLMAALGMGADAVMMGTAFMATRECPMKESFKESIIKRTPDDADLRQRIMGQPVLHQSDKEATEPHDRDWSLSASFAAGVINKVPTVKELIDSIISEAEGVINSWKFYKSPLGQA